MSDYNVMKGSAKPRLCAYECSTCIFKPDSPFRTGPGKLSDGRFKQLVADAVAEDSYVICHDTMNGAEPAICRGFYTRFSTNILRIWTRLGGFNEVAP